MTEEVCIEVEDVSYKYHQHTVIEDINFSVKSGEYLGIIGPNGGGKSTLIKVILGLLKPDTGHVKIFGEEVTHLKDRYRLGYLPQRASQAVLHFPATVEEIVKSGRTAKVGMLRRFGAEDLAAVEKALEIAEVADLRDRIIGNLSGGERQRVFIARALAGEPKVLILDEPVAGVDVPAQETFYSFLEDLNRKHGLTIIIISHDIDVVAHQSTNVLCLNHRLVCHGRPKDFITEEHLEKLYGKKLRFLLHGH